MIKLILRLVLGLVAVLLVAGVVAYAAGARLPVTHVISVTGTVGAPPDKVFGIITNVADGASWRKEVKSVQVLRSSGGRDEWIEDLGSGMTMHFVALDTTPPDPAGHALRKIDLKDPQYGGSWTYDLEPGADGNTTQLTITEDGYINSPVYRALMKYVFGPTRNLDQYMAEIKARAAKP